ncbi:hypothetical protein BN7_3029 [Wickerhamomyces ciferrii]|uniref:Uncharacterized protein n=1 Tax=Wickerhamomyces ciferrii (strain ATCC 14091 / BCRC 22168 / CBS 111 / JCM 3599 / NBRC 0793 / NRRL Y-1031 F-60-10) TaxID=1206466 RepID=K0KPX3_WICCF|nr:uncharacterized protein BN7_3029 [Wickerhamomyces ciferrii]CCH43479.1 hypothetical protein BN7_3029 [Wickerhamomyces ciferrii]
MSMRVFKCASAMLKTQSKNNQILPYWRMIRTIEEFSEKSSKQDNNETKKVIRINKHLARFTLADYKQLIEMDSKYQNSKFHFQILGQFHKDNEFKLRSLPIFERILENKIHGFFTKGLIKKNSDPLDAFKSDEKLVKSSKQLFFVENKHGNFQYQGVKGFNVAKPLIQSIPFKFETTDLDLKIQALEIFPFIKAIGINIQHPLYNELISKTINFPLVGEIKFIETDLTSSNELIALVPSFILSHRKHFTELEYPVIKFGKIPKPGSETNEISTPMELATLVSQEFGLLPPLTDVITPYVIDEYINEKEDDVNLTEIPQADEILNFENYETNLSSRYKSISFSNKYVYNTPKKQFNFDLEKINQRKFEDFIFKNHQLNSKTPLSNIKKNSIDLIRSIILTQNSISDLDILQEYDIVNVWSSVLQFIHSEFYEDSDKFQYFPSLKEYLEFNSNLVKPWDKFILGNFYQIENKSKFNEFLPLLAQYLTIIKNESDKSIERIEFSKNLIMNIIYRLLFTDSMYYYPGLSKFYINEFQFNKFDLMNETMHLTTTQEDGTQVNKFNKNLKYNIETIDYEPNYKHLFKLIQSITSIDNYTQFYSLNTLIKTDSSIILENQEILQNSLKTLWNNQFHKDDSTPIIFLSNNYQNPLFLNHNYNERPINCPEFIMNKHIRFNSGTDEEFNIFYYRDPKINIDSISESLKLKISKLKLDIKPEDSLLIKKQKLMNSFIDDVLHISKKRQFRHAEINNLILFIMEFVIRLPPNFFEIEEIKQSYDQDEIKRKVNEYIKLEESDSNDYPQVKNIAYGIVQDFNRGKRSPKKPKFLKIAKYVEPEDEFYINLKQLIIDIENPSPILIKKLENLNIEHIDPIDSLFTNKKKLLHAFIIDLIKINSSHVEKIDNIKQIIKIVSNLSLEFFQSETILNSLNEKSTNIKTSEQDKINENINVQHIEPFIKSLEPIIENTKQIKNLLLSQQIEKFIDLVYKSDENLEINENKILEE